MSSRRAVGACLAAWLLALCPVADAVSPEPEAVRWLQDYLQIDTTNPPGNEREAAEYLAGILGREGIESRIVESPAGRASLVARLAAPGSGGKAIALLHHLDVVPAGEPWKQPAFSGRIVEGRMWGRGALDAKSLGIAQLAALVALKREGAALRRDVVLLAVADEERGGGEGAGWLLDAHPGLLAGVEAVLNEGGMNRVFRGKVLFWGIEVAQKRPLWLRLRASGRGGHASSLNLDSATHRLVRGLARVLDRPLRWRVSEPARVFFQALARFDGSGEHGFASKLDEVILPDGPTVALAPGMPTYFLDTLQVTEIETGGVSNAVAPEATASIDARLLPDTDVETFLAEVEAALGPSIEVEVVLQSPEVPSSPVEGPAFRALERTLGVRAPVVPTFIGGTTDSRYFRARGIPAYGFSPFAIEPDEGRGIHAVDEAISVEELRRGVETMRRVLLALAS